MSCEPWVTVLMPAYNSEVYIAGAIDSVLAQTFPNFELLIIDDGSTDDTKEIARSYVLNDPRVRFIGRDHNGLVDTLNFGLQQAHGRYLARQDADDCSDPKRLEAQWRCLESQPDLVIVGSSYVVIDPAGFSIRVDRMPQTDTAIRWHGLFHAPFAHTSVMLRLDVLRSKDLRYNATMGEAEDYCLWTRLLQYGRGYNLPEPLVQYRLHPGQASQRGKSAVWDLAGRVAQENLATLGEALPLEQVQQLREWYYAFPQRFTPQDLPLAEALIGILNRFSLQPGLDRFDIQRLRGRWLGRLLRAGARGGDRGWFVWLLRQLSWADLRDVVAYARRREVPQSEGAKSTSRKAL